MKDGLQEAARLIDLMIAAELEAREANSIGNVPISGPAGTASAAKVSALKNAAWLMRERAGMC
jgi:hypothetical protein